GHQARAAAPASASQRLAFTAPSPAASRGFGLVGAANAAPAPLRPAIARSEAASGGNWAVQVGAFANQGQARSAAAAAAGTAGGRVQVLPVSQGRTTLYRARVIGLSPAAAQNACEKHRRGGCMVLSPDAQS
ncbi:SPOR domain-containing protein, partial [Siccirubricoccus sp. KC 17139]